MRFASTSLDGVTLVELEERFDDRGFFARSYCPEEFAAAGIEHVVAQENVSFNHLAGTCRGVHFQTPPHAEAKLVRCTAGAVFDVAVDLRPESPTFGTWFGAELTAANRRALYVPPRCGHAYLTLVNDTEVTYQVNAAYSPGAEGGLSPTDQTLSIAWPIVPMVISDKDRAWAPFDEQVERLRVAMKEFR